MQYLILYYWISFFISFAACVVIPTKQPPIANLIGSAVVALGGFVLWPALVYCIYILDKRERSAR